jgi:hypothetical protein
MRRQRWTQPKERAGWIERKPRDPIVAVCVLMIVAVCVLMMTVTLLIMPLIVLLMPLILIPLIPPTSPWVFPSCLPLQLKRSLHAPRLNMLMLRTIVASGGLVYLLIHLEMLPLVLARWLHLCMLIHLKMLSLVLARWLHLRNISVAELHLWPGFQVWSF